MANTDPKIMSLVEKELEKNPDASVDDLYDKAKAKDASISELSHRQFHARYPLQVKRRKGGKTRKRRAPKKKAGRSRARANASTKANARARTKANASGRASTRANASAGQEAQRDKVRDAFLSFATALTAAEDRSDLVKVLANVDSYVKAVLKATRS